MRKILIKKMRKRKKGGVNEITLIKSRIKMSVQFSPIQQ